MKETFETSDLAHAAYCLDEGLVITRKTPGRRVIIHFEGENAQQIAANYLNADGLKAKNLLECYQRVRDYALDPSVRGKKGELKK